MTLFIYEKCIKYMYTTVNVMILSKSKNLDIWHSKDKFIDIFSQGLGGKDKFNPI